MGSWNAIGSGRTASKSKGLLKDPRAPTKAGVARSPLCLLRIASFGTLVRGSRAKALVLCKIQTAPLPPQMTSRAK